MGCAGGKCIKTAERDDVPRLNSYIERKKSSPDGMKNGKEQKYEQHQYDEVVLNPQSESYEEPQPVTQAVSVADLGEIHDSTEGDLVAWDSSPSQVPLLSQERALPELPKSNGHAARRSVHSTGSPSQKRALPDIPSQLSAAEDTYDHLERNMPSHSIKAKSKSTRAPHTGQNYFQLEEPELATQSKAVNSLKEAANKDSLYASIEAPSPASAAQPQAASAHKQKVIDPYSKVKKSVSANGDGNSVDPAKRSTKQRDGDTLLNHRSVAEDSDYSFTPPIPVKRFDDRSEDAVATDSTEEGYLAVGSEPLLNPSAQDDQTESYDILTARESIDRVRERQQARAKQEGYYECVDEVPRLLPARAPQSGQIYAEIDQQGSTRSQAAATRVEELYAEIDGPRRHNADSPRPPNFDAADLGDYAVVNEPPVGVARSGLLKDEADYAECADVRVIEDGAVIADPGYATVTVDRAGQSSASQQNSFQNYKRREHLYQEIEQFKGRDNSSDK